MLQIPGLYLVDTEDRGRGVFSSKRLSREDVIEICPLIIIPPDQVSLIDQTIVHDYYFEFPEPQGAACIALGYGCLYNHSSEPNARVAFEIQEEYLQIITIKPISSGEEIMIDYLAGEAKKLWFVVQ